MIHLSLRWNKAYTVKVLQSDWPSLANRDIRKRYTLAIRHMFDIRQEISEKDTPIDEHENIVTAIYKQQPNSL